jgi:hypothetical protein
MVVGAGSAVEPMGHHKHKNAKESFRNTMPRSALAGAQKISPQARQNGHE